MSLLKPSKKVDAVVESITENMLAGVVEAKYESLEKDITKLVASDLAGEDLVIEVMAAIRLYFPPEVEYAQQLADLKAKA